MVFLRPAHTLNHSYLSANGRKSVSEEGPLKVR